MKLIKLTIITGDTVAIPVGKITAILEDKTGCKVFVGVFESDGDEHYWYVRESFPEVFAMLEAIKE